MWEHSVSVQAYILPVRRSSDPVECGPVLQARTCRCENKSRRLRQAVPLPNVISSALALKLRARGCPHSSLRPPKEQRPLRRRAIYPLQNRSAKVRARLSERQPRSILKRRPQDGFRSHHSPGQLEGLKLRHAPAIRRPTTGVRRRSRPRPQEQGEPATACPPRQLMLTRAPQTVRLYTWLVNVSLVTRCARPSLCLSRAK